jgi:glycosyltransferase involved in cell wall biosynthesis
MTTTPLVSVIIPTYNRAHLIGETLVSVLSQTYLNWECIIVDDGSTDNTLEIVTAFLDRDNRFQYHQRPTNRTKGACACRNYGFELAKGVYINWLDSDDLFSSNKIETQVNLLMEYDTDISVTKWGRFSDKSDFKIKEMSIYRNYNKGADLLKDYGESGMFYPSHSFLVKKEVVLKAGQWNNHLQINQDGEFFCRILLICNKVGFAKDSYVLYRSTGSNSVSRLNSIEKAEHAVTSVKLIEGYLIVSGNKEKCMKYINNCKLYCYGLLLKDNKRIIRQNKCFFKDQIEEDVFLNKIKRKVIRIFKF